ncbi:alpha/beta hydrolase [Azoarcus sp. PA01]|nr:alpha/beta hydrolase [Azoarcus sp. PA01]
MKPNPESRCEQLDVRGLRYNVRHWGAADAPPVFFLHGWMDNSATFQFVVAALAQDWHVIAPDWRGYGASEWLRRPYWFPDYYADLDALLAHYSPHRPARLVGHSMGGNIAGVYSGVRPQRVSQVAMLDVLGLKDGSADEAPKRLAQWLDAVPADPQLRRYADHDALARRLQQANPRLTEERAAFLARNVSRVLPDGQVEMACDPWHKTAAPAPYRLGDTLACWRTITAPVLLLISDQGYVLDRFPAASDDYRERLACFADVRVATVTDAGHNLQHDQPEQVAAALESFLLRD